MKKTCEICGDTVTRTEKAIKCGHTVYLCEVCKKVCSTALDFCAKCENTR